MSSPIQCENISGYHSNSRCFFICCQNIIQYKVFLVLNSVDFLIQGGDILQLKVAPVCVMVVLHHVPTQGHEFQYKVKIFSNSRLPLCWVLVVLHLIPIQEGVNILQFKFDPILVYSVKCTDDVHNLRV